MTEGDYKQYDLYMKTRLNIHNENLANVLTSGQRVDSSWCSKYYKTHVAVEYSEESLAEVLHKRRRLTRDDPGKWMSEPEMWYIIRAVANGCAALESHGLLHGDIQPRHILIMHDDTVKLFEAPLLSQYFNGYNRVLQEQDYNAALSPQELEALRSDYLYRTLNPGLSVHQPFDQRTATGITGILEKQQRIADPTRNHDLDQFQDTRIKYIHTEKDEVFALGITALCSACNNPLTDFYDIKTLTLNHEKINQKLVFMRELGYSPQLIDLVTSMLNLDARVRPTLANILGIVNRPYSVVGNNGQVIGHAHPGPISQNQGGALPPGFIGTQGPIPVQTQPRPSQLQPGQPIPPITPLNPGMAAFQQGIPQRSPVNVGPVITTPGAPITYAPAQTTQTPLNPGMAAFQGSPLARPPVTSQTQAYGTVSPSYGVNQRVSGVASVRT